MDKKTIDQMLPVAYEALVDSKIVVNNKIVKTYRGNISTFGAAINGGSLLAAISFFSEKGGASEDRTKLMKAISKVLNEVYKKENINIDEKCNNSLFDFVVKHSEDKILWKERIINAAIALKLAMNLFELVEPKKINDTSKEGE